MRRTALFLGGLFLATGASLALAGPASAADTGCRKPCNSGGGLAVVHSAPRPIILDVEDDDCYYPSGYLSSYSNGGGYVHGLSGGYGGGDTNVGLLNGSNILSGIGILGIGGASA
ncbi:hypothetical protein AB0F81_17140 [Actinoplanes sp. NPDC024001]|uniref:hypothetical protein n=1 Tax=Actinoplanes sp. NPDC024001 TaxID=3154598 RepID=UPI0033C2DBF5